MNQATPRVSTNVCEWVAERRTLVVSSEAFAGSFPRRVEIESHYTGRVVTFVPVGPGDSRWDEDGWDGEQCVYRASDVTARAETLVIRHEL